MGIENPGAAADAAAAGAGARLDGGASPGGTPGQGAAEAVDWKAKAEHWEREAKNAFAARDGAKKAFLESEDGRKLTTAQQQLEEITRKQALEAEEAAKKRGEYEKLYGEAKTRAEQLEAQIAELSKKHQTDLADRDRRVKVMRAREALEAAYRGVGGVDPEAFLILTAKSIDDGDIKVDDDGKVTGVEAIVKKQQDARPHLFGKKSEREGTTTTKRRSAAPEPKKTEGGLSAVRTEWQKLRERERGR